MIDSQSRLEEIARFLRERRARLQPNASEANARPAKPRRRVPGLTREEVAARAGMSLTWYTGLESGREIRVSASTLSSLARALELNADEALYLLTLADEGTRRQFEREASLAPGLLEELVNHYEHCPAFVVNRRWDVLASNGLARSIYRFLPSISIEENILWRLFYDDELRAMHGSEIEGVAASVAAIVRFNYADDPADEQLLELVEALSSNERFIRLWNRYEAHPFVPIVVTLLLDGVSQTFTLLALALVGRSETLVVHLTNNSLKP